MQLFNSFDDADSLLWAVNNYSEREAQFSVAFH